MSSETTVDDLMSRIAAEYEGLSRQLKIVAKYLEDNRASIMVDRISEIAERCGIQPSAVVRFAQRFGFSGFSELQDVFRSAYTQQTNAPVSYSQRVRKLVSRNPHTLSPLTLAQELIQGSRDGLARLATSLDEESLALAVKLLAAADGIYVVGVRRSFPAASYLVYALQHTNKRVHLLSGDGGMFREQLRSVRKNDVIVAISFNPYAKETQYCLRAAKHQQAKSIVITDGQLSPLARHADVMLTVQEGGAFAFRSLSSTMCLCQALFLALAYKLELDLEKNPVPEAFDD